MSDKLPAAIGNMPDPNRMRVGKVSSYDSNTLIISMTGGEIRNPGILNGAGLRAGATVAIFRQDSTWLVLGVIQDPATTGTFLAPICKIYQVAAQGFTSGTQAAFDFDTLQFDSTGGSMWDAGTPGQITVPMPGYYLIGGGGSWVANATGARGVLPQVNGFNQTGGWSRQLAAGGSVSTQIPVRPQPEPLNTGDVVTLTGFQNSGTSPLNSATGTSAERPTLSLTWLRPL